MGTVAEVFVATDEEARGCESAGRFQALQLRGLTSLEFEILWAILDGWEWGPDSPNLHAVRSGGERWTFKFPAPFVSRLRELDALDMAAAAERWAATDELGCIADDVEPVIAALVALAHSFDDDERGLFLLGEL
jgi:hypothetical protein